MNVVMNVVKTLGIVFLLAVRLSCGREERSYLRKDDGHQPVRPSHSHHRELHARQAQSTAANFTCHACPCLTDAAIQESCNVITEAMGIPLQSAGCHCLCPKEGIFRVFYPDLHPPANDARQNDRRLLYQQVLQHPALKCGGMFVAFYDDFSSLTLDVRKSLWRIKAPLLSHSLITESIGNSKYVIFEPEYKFVRHRGFQDIIARVRARNQFPYASKIPKVVWRGSSYGATWGAVVNERFNASLVAKDFPWCDVGISQSVSREQDSFYDAVHVSKNYIPEESWNSYRGMLDIVGTTNAGGLYWRMASGTVVFKIESAWTCSIIEKMVPWEHYIPIKQDLSDMGNITQIVTMDVFAPLLQNIADNAYRLAQEFTLEKEVERVAQGLQALWAQTNVVVV
jgi:hypothetical protein